MAGVASLQAQQTRMNVIGNNLANANTTAFKSNSLSFEDMLSQTVNNGSPPSATNGGTDPEQFGLGVAVGSTTTNMSQGSLASTNVPSDLAIQGNGFFAVTNGTSVSYTRDGNFSVDADGYLVQNATGQRLLGWPAGPGGVVSPSAQISSTNELQIPLGTAITAQPTSNVNLTGNLEANAASSYTWSTQVQVYNSLGTAETVTVEFSNPQTPPPAGSPAGATASWDWNAYLGSSASGTPIGDSTTAGNEPLYFSATGQYVNPFAGAATNVMTVPASGGASANSINLDMNSITQLDSSSSVDLGSQDGVGPGTLDSYAIGSSGMITGVFANGLTRPLGQVAVTTFANPNGLLNLGTNLWGTSVNSGTAVSGAAGTGSAGTLNAGYLEQSNVDVGTELTSLIVCQQGYEANTKIISTVNQMFQSLEQMIQ
jgi:flagellar hook protein FlgE